MNEELYLEGMAAVKGALLGPGRTVHEILADRKRDDRGTAWLLRTARTKGVPVRMMVREELDKIAEGASHGGILAVVGERHYLPLERLMPQDDIPFIVMLDGVEDPYNYGFALRTLWAAGVHGLVVRRRNWSTAAAVVARSSAGASELFPTAVVDSPDEAADFFRDQGCAIAVTAKEKESLSLYEADLARPLFLLIGGERRGVKRSFLDRADLLLNIPYGRDYRQSLGTASAAGVVAFEAMRQRQAGSRK